MKTRTLMAVGVVALLLAPARGQDAKENADFKLAANLCNDKLYDLALLPQGKPKRKQRVERMIDQMDKEGFGNCSNNYAGEAECPKQIPVTHIARLNREFIRAKVV